MEDLNSSLGHVTKTLIPWLETTVLELASSVNMRFKALVSKSNLAASERGPLAPDHVDNTNSSADDADGSRGSAPARTQAQPPLVAPPLVDVSGNDNSDTEPHAHDRNAPNAPPDHTTSACSTAPLTPLTTAGTNISPNVTYTLPTGHLGSGLRGPTMASPAPARGNNMSQMAWSDMHQYHSVHPPVPAQLSDTLSRPPISSCL